jgi:hypothetical protein
MPKQDWTKTNIYKLLNFQITSETNFERFIKPSRDL